MTRSEMFVVLMAAMYIASITNAYSQSFSCTFGEPACLDYGAKVCSSSAKCVDQNAICFDSFTCDYKGFVCKSDYDEAVDEIDDKVRRYNALVNDFNSLKAKYLESESERENISAKLSNLIDCLEYASSLEEAQDCQP
ncbi:hypothetical protein [Roseibium aggregatum]|uniref:Uncharacterized protein n=1 Tax=Roseibium aggregatum TaxID=187304 RepID=A0A926S9P7_9HYPH|nr:hypothetical protein [Roseibium aggregatum]MBD1547344.1 hypothetical protein [Roseibium aggregatum]